MSSWEDFRRWLGIEQALPPEVLEARRIYDEDCEQFWDEHMAGDQAAIDRNQLYMSELTQAECRAGIHRCCAHEETHDDTEYMSPMGYAAEPVGVVWGTVNPDGTVTNRGFTDSEDYRDDSAVYPAESLVAYHPDDNTYVHMATGQTVERPREIDAERAERNSSKAAEQVGDAVEQYQQAKQEAAEAAVTAVTSPAPSSSRGATTGGAGMSHASEGNAQIQQAGQNIDNSMGAIQQIVSELEAALQNLMGAADESQHGEGEAAKGALQQAIQAANDLMQQVGAAKQATEQVRL